MIWINNKFMQEPEVRAYINELTVELEAQRAVNARLHEALTAARNDTLKLIAIIDDLEKHLDKVNQV